MSQPAQLRLTDYARSTAAWRVRIALAWKGLDWQREPVDLAGGEQHAAALRNANPQGLIPTLFEGDVVLSQSLAILEYLEETHPEPALLPEDPGARARVRQLALLISCDVHPLQNLRVRRHLGAVVGLAEESQAGWCRHWIGEGLAAYERLVANPSGRFSCGDRPSLADLCLVPQLYNARRYGNDVSTWPRLLAIEAACAGLPAFLEAAPDDAN